MISVTLSKTNLSEMPDKSFFFLCIVRTKRTLIFCHNSLLLASGEWTHCHILVYLKKIPGSILKSIWDSMEFWVFLTLVPKTGVAVSRKYDTYFGKGLVMGYADCKCSSVWLKHQSSFNRKLGPLSDTLQAGAWLFPLTASRHVFIFHQRLHEKQQHT